MQKFDLLTPPTAEKRPHTTTHHGIPLVDDYKWLRDKDWQDPQDGVKDPDIKAYLAAENAYTDAFFREIEDEVERLFQESKGYFPDMYESLKLREGDYLYFYRQYRSQNYPMYLRQKVNSQGEEEVYFDVNKEAEGKGFFKLGGKRISPDQLWLAYSVDEEGNEYHTLHIRNLKTGTELPDRLENVSGGVIWVPDNSGFYYLKHNDQWRTLYLYFHALNTSQSADILVFEETDDAKSVHMNRTFDKKYLIVTTGTREDNAVYYLDLTSAEVKKGGAKPTLLLPSQDKREVEIHHHEGYFYAVMTTLDYPNRWVARLPVSNVSADFEEVIPHDPAHYLSMFETFKTHFLLSYKIDGLEQIMVMDPETRARRSIPVTEACYDLATIEDNYEDDFFYYELSSLARPKTVYKVSFRDLSQQVVKAQEVPGFDLSLYRIERHWATARDGVKVPISLAYRIDKIKEGAANPLLLYGYGSYEISVEPYFSERRLSYLDNGFIYAIAHIRGGGDLGHHWYLDGKYLKKKNTFHDFIDCAKYLIEKGYTQPEKLSAMGGSAGGMLMGYVANNAPELFNSIAAIVPFVDVMNTMLDDSLPLTKGEFKEWGNPIESEAYFNYMLSYSPYDQVKKQAYPAILITGGEKDSRVTYWEPTKWAAKLRELNTGKQPLLLKMIMSVGHAGGSKRDESLREYAEYLAFYRQANGMLSNKESVLKK